MLVMVRFLGVARSKTYIRRPDSSFIYLRRLRPFDDVHTYIHDTYISTVYLPTYVHTYYYKQLLVYLPLKFNLRRVTRWAGRVLPAPR